MLTAVHISKELVLPGSTDQLLQSSGLEPAGMQIRFETLITVIGCYSMGMKPVLVHKYL